MSLADERLRVVKMPHSPYSAIIRKGVRLAVDRLKTHAWNRSFLEDELAADLKLA
jgi:hypothetical protein